MIELNKTSHLPFYRQIEDWLRAEIAAGRITENAQIPDERVLAKRLKLSRMTVRRAIMTLTDDGLLYRVRGRGTFVAQKRPTAKTPAQSSIAQVGVVSPLGATELRQSFFYYRILEGFQSVTFEQRLSLVHRRVTPPYPEFAASLVREAKLDALMILGIVDPEILLALTGQGLPVVLVDSTQPPGAKPLDHITHSSEDGAFQSTLHLLELGHRRITMLSFGPTPAALEREAGFTRALASRGIAASPESIVRADCNGSAAYAAVRRILREPQPPTAIFCATDETAIGAINAVKDQGLRVPHDVSIAGFGDLGYFSQPALTSVRIPVEEIGRKAAAVLRARLDHPDAPPVELLFPTEFVARASTDLPREH